MKIVNQEGNVLVDTRRVWKCKNTTTGNFEILCDEGVLATYLTEDKMNLEFNKIVGMADLEKTLTMSCDDITAKYLNRKQERYNNYNYHGRLISKNDFLIFFMSQAIEKLSLNQYRECSYNIKLSLALKEACKKFDVYYSEPLYNSLIHNVDSRDLCNRYFRSLNLAQYRDKTHYEEEQ